MRHTARKRQRVARNQVMDPIADQEGDRPLKQHDLLVLACVGVQRQGAAE
jgi:hypothetical protein